MAEVYEPITLTFHRGDFTAMVSVGCRSRNSEQPGTEYVYLSPDTKVKVEGKPVPDSPTLLGWFLKQKRVRLEADVVLQKYGWVREARFTAG